LIWGAPKLNLLDEKEVVAAAAIFKTDRLSIFFISPLHFCWQIAGEYATDKTRRE
jgi:hypothetical protein